MSNFDELFRKLQNASILVMNDRFVMFARRFRANVVGLLRVGYGPSWRAAFGHKQTPSCT